MTFARSSLEGDRHPLQAVAGFTLIESVMVIALLAIVGIYVMPKAFDSGPMTLNAQARNFAANLQQAQLLAITEGVPVNVQVTSSTYTIPLNIGQLTAQTVALEPGTTFVDSSVGNGYYFDSLGQPTNNLGQAAATWSFQLQASGSTSPIVTVETVSGWITGP
jgi:prepilin-type N-terminal cleavage/methylation domain-containing protein